MGGGCGEVREGGGAICYLLFLDKERDPYVVGWLVAPLSASKDLPKRDAQN